MVIEDREESCWLVTDTEQSAALQHFHFEQLPWKKANNTLAEPGAPLGLDCFITFGMCTDTCMSQNRKVKWYSPVMISPHECPETCYHSSPSQIHAWSHREHGCRRPSSSAAGRNQRNSLSYPPSSNFRNGACLCMIPRFFRIKNNVSGIFCLFRKGTSVKVTSS